ncbi:hypothetical protein [Micromonospora craniellae]|uniref:DUF3168 domain-containing protein n=1 Tax=Micromonospora craniellae TaxID=2294034 RepID=A0A372G2A4_9ACTN|nr:hypothetical protein [Micromonospora craniellae]QOC89879.1 hypothetical protein ID554_16715 [Micromonospora craniellae]RFS47024.1 hypothetical protein D0Q02_07630 [Micromonospora craniellae]
MVRPLVVFGDAQAAAAGVLRGRLATRPEPYAGGVTVAGRLPAGRSPEQPHLPFVLVAVDDDEPTYPVSSLVTLRLTVWHRDTDAAFDLAQMCRGLLLVHTGPVIRSCRVAAGVGPIRGVDPDTEIDLATTTVEAYVRPIRLDP